MPEEPLKQDPAAGRIEPALPPHEGVVEDQTLSDHDQTTADSDQTGADFDQTAADADETASERDQHASDRDQDAADLDQAAGVRHGAGNGYAKTRRDRFQSSVERDQASHTRTRTARVRDEAAARRDQMADERDAAARARDELAATADDEMERTEFTNWAADGEPPNGSAVALRRSGDRQRAAAGRTRAATQRDAAAGDRDLAAEDRKHAARDRRVGAEELAAEGVDHLTGALRRRAGCVAMQREMDRTRRSGEDLVVAFVDVDGLKGVNDTDGHAAGDELLRDVARSITQQLRSYDVITRLGGDEFVCSLSGQDAGGARKRFKQISTSLSEAASGATITVGLAERDGDDSLDQLIDRADAAMIDARNRPEA